MATEMLFTDPDGDGQGTWSADASTPIGDFALRSYVDSLHASQAVQVAAALDAANSVSTTAASANAAATAAVAKVNGRDVWCVGDVMVARPFSDPAVRVIWHKATAPTGGGYPNAEARDGWEYWGG